MMSLGERFLLAATVTDVQDRQYLYEACKICYTKLLDTGKSLICKKCNCSYSTESACYRYCVHLTAADSSGLANITVFGSVLDTFFGTGCSEFYFSHVLKLKNRYGDFVDTIIRIAIEQTFIGQNLIFGFKVPKSFCSKKGKNCEISLIDIARISPNWQRVNNPNVLPELIAVQLLPQTNSHLSFTVIQALDILEKNIQEMGYSQLSEKACDFIRASEIQNIPSLCNLSSHLAHLNSSNRSFHTSEDFSQTSLGLSCDTSLASEGDIQSPKILKVSGVLSIVSPATPGNVQVSPLTSKIRSGNEIKTNLVQSGITKNDLCGNSFCGIRNAESTCSTSQKHKSTNQEFLGNILEEGKIKPEKIENNKTRKADGVSLETSKLTWSVVKYNRENASLVKRLRLGKVENSKCSSIACEGSGYQWHVHKENECNQKLEGEEETINGAKHRAYSATHSLRYVKDNTFDVDQMPESEDLELFLAATNADAIAYLESSKSPLERKNSPKNSEIAVCVSQNVAEHCQEQNVVTHDRSGDKTDLQDESLSITDDYARSISFNVTLRRFKKRRSGSKFSPPCSHKNNNLDADLPESENLCQFLDRFPVANNNYNSLNVSSGKLSESDAPIEDTLSKISYYEVKNSEDLFTSPASADLQQSSLVGDKNCTSAAVPRSNSLHLNSPSKEKETVVCKASDAELLTPHKISGSGEELVIPCSSESFDDFSFITLTTKATSEFLSSDEGVLTHKDITDHQREEKSKRFSLCSSFNIDKNYCNTSHEPLLSNSLDLFNSPECSRMHLDINLCTGKSCRQMKPLENSSPINHSPNSSQIKLQRGEKFLYKRPPTVTSDNVPYKKVRFTSHRKENYFHDFDLIKTWAIPPAPKTLKSCLKLRKFVHGYDTSSPCSEDRKSNPREVNSEDLFAEEEGYSCRKSISSPASYDDSADLFSQSPVSDVSCVTSKYSAAPSPHIPTVTLLCDVQNAFGTSGFESSLELFSQSAITSTPTCNGRNQVFSLQNCMTPDLFD
ncbi:hypothetical protein Btru_031881 [Bulinus truncatus]|nr:hypothetical protein Btru_031881 [Bulinus truncatus]